MNETLADTNAPRAFSKVIEINAREWFDKVHGNSYFAAYVTVWNSPEYADNVTYILPFQYGYESQAKQAALWELFKMGAIPTEKEYELRHAGVLVTFAKSNRPKRDLPTVKSCEAAKMPRVAPDVPVFIA